MSRDLDALEAWAGRTERSIIGSAIDRNVSGSVPPDLRPDLGRWIKEPEAWDELAITTADRLSRDTLHGLTFLRWAEQSGHSVVAVNENLHWPPHESEDRADIEMRWTLGFMVATAERSRGMDRGKKAREEIKKNGAFWGAPPFGFRIEGERYHKRLVPDPKLVPIVKRLVAMATDGAPYIELSRYLADATGKPPKKDVNIKDILTNPSLKGRRMNDEMTKVVHRHEGILTVAEWDRLQDALANRYPGKRASWGPTPLLTGMLWCGKCGERMSGSRSPHKLADGTVKVYGFYRCQNTKGTRCNNSIPMTGVHAWLDRLFTQESAIADREILASEWVDGDADRAAEIEEVEAELREAITGDDDALIDRLRARRRELRATPLVGRHLVTAPTGDRCRDLWARLDTAGRRDYLLRSDVRVTVASKTAPFDATNTPADTVAIGLSGRVVLAGEPQVLLGVVTEP